ncbi:Arginine exporter protein ArgO [Nocardioides dokdonensis FR1436]|uniref:Arginine exporter protein ArgO n=1 Tax=Nocardioides dokdonensis FR1436 TaxID=1300347 RepID=A0A1A9GIW6_9ACTN|nr:LysE/ArgO family amino acid transporter [Nocardioides dokdonensis]ANH37451.1 Arginine exporter protein ArgO [Nocardioides dokdonensis FR1436]
MTTVGAGFLAGLSLIIAIGSQNAFVLRQGLARQQVGPVVAVCMLSDIVLISAGVAGIGTLVEQAPWVLEAVRWGGAAFLTAYGVLSLRRAARGGGTLEAAARGVTRLAPALLTALALTWLNPHVYLDTVLLLGSLASGYGPDGRWLFATGAALGSVVWFLVLGYGARLASGLFARPTSWRVLDAVIGVIMLGLAASLALG